MGKKLVELSKEDKAAREDEDFMMKRPNRMEVANYVNSLLDQKYMPHIDGKLTSVKLGLMIIQSILIDKGICTGEEIESITKDFLERYKSEEQKEIAQ